MRKLLFFVSLEAGLGKKKVGSVGVGRGSDETVA
jgi:hypothetical protein